jgi:hypothetical protein
MVFSELHSKLLPKSKIPSSEQENPAHIAGKLELEVIYAIIAGMFFQCSTY